MNAKKSLLIHIPNPCSQDWDEMTPEGRGRHCHHCRQTVIDFPSWSDRELFHFFSKNDKQVCGRYLDTRLTGRQHPLFT